MRLQRTLMALATLALPALLAGQAAAKPDKDLAERAIKMLERGVKAGDFDIRAMAIEGLGMAPKARAIGPVKDALSDPQWKVRSSAIVALRTLKDGSWEKETAISVCDMAVDPATGIFPLIESMGPAKGVALVLKGLEAKDCPKPERYVKLFVMKGGDWLLTAMKAGQKVKTQTVKAAFEAELPTLPLIAALPIYKEGLAKYPADLQKSLVTRLSESPEAAEVKDLAFVKPLMKSTDPEVLFLTSSLLALRGDASGKATLVAALASPDGARRLAAMKALVPIADNEVFELMKAKIKDRETPYEELVAAYTVYLKSGSKKLVTYLEGELESTDLPQRAAAVHFLGRVKGREALLDLHPLLQRDAKPIRLAACNAIGELALRESIPVLRDALARETDKELKIAMIQTLAKMKDIEAIPVARFYITDSDPDVRREAVKAIIAVPDPSGAVDLETATGDRVRDIREMAFFALIEQDPENRFMLFEKSLEWLPPEAFQGFVKRHGDKVKRHVALVLTNNRDDLRSTAWALTKTLSKPVQIELATELATKNERQLMRLAALERLVELQGKDAIPTLEAFAKDPDDKVRVLAIASLGRLGHKPGIAALTESLDDPSERVRVAVAGAVLKL